jgi:hypothetical protein
VSIGERRSAGAAIAITTGGSLIIASAFIPDAKTFAGVLASLCAIAFIGSIGVLMGAAE